MFKEIGGNFWLEREVSEDGIPSDLLLTNFPENENVVYSSTGRGALSLILRNINIPKKRVLIPSYICESVIKSFECHNYDIDFYEIDLDLTIDIDTFSRLVEEFDSGIIFLSSYYGLDTLKNLRSKFCSFKNRGIIIIEDLTHLFFGDTGISQADYRIASLRKWLPLPDGGVAISKNKAFKICSHQVHHSFVDMNLKAMRAKREYVKYLDIKLKNEYRSLYAASENVLDFENDFHEMSKISRLILNETDFLSMRKSRRNNYRHLDEFLKTISWLRPVFDFLPENVVPLFFPVYISRKRDDVQKYLIENEIYSPIHWPVPTHLRSKMTEKTSYIYNNILSLPCDQRYSDPEMDRICHVLKEFNNV